jgi:hypothetical protein
MARGFFAEMGGIEAVRARSRIVFPRQSFRQIRVRTFKIDFSSMTAFGPAPTASHK